MTKMMLAGAIAAIAILAPAAASAQAPVVGSVSYTTARTCTINQWGICSTGPVFQSEMTGGVGQTSASQMVTPLGSTAFGSVDFNNSSLPVLRASSASVTGERVNANILGFQTLQYTGTTSIDLAISGMVHYLTSGDLNPNNEYQGEGVVSGYLGIWKPSIIDGYTTAQQLFDNLFFRNCGTDGVIAAGGFGSFGTTGDVNRAVGLNENCNGGGITLNPGDSVLVVARMQTPSNSGGWVDATNTFNVLFDTDKTVFTGTTERVGAAFLASNISAGTAVAAAVPEPSTWLMMLLGFGFAGSMLRRQQRVARAAPRPLTV